MFTVKQGVGSGKNVRHFIETLKALDACLLADHEHAVRAEIGMLADVEAFRTQRDFSCRNCHCREQLHDSGPFKLVIHVVEYGAEFACKRDTNAKQCSGKAFI
jgi:hypothetical protein